MSARTSTMVKITQFLFVFVLCFHISFASDVLFSSLNVPSFVQGQNAVITGTVAPSSKYIESVDFNFLNEETTGIEMGEVYPGMMDTSFIPNNGNGFGVGSINTTGGTYTVYDFHENTDGSMYIVGDFTTYNGVPRKNIAKVKADGTLDTTFDITSGSDVSTGIGAVAVQSDGKIIIGGYFRVINNSITPYLARLNTDGTTDSSFNFNGKLSQYVTSVFIDSNSRILVGGAFNTYDGLTRNKILRLNPDGTLDTSFDPGVGPTAAVYKIIELSGGKYLVRGDFSTWNGLARKSIAVLNPDGSLDMSFDPGTGANATIYGVDITHSGKIIIGGAFTSYNGVARNRVARLNLDGSLDTSFDPGVGPNNSVAHVIEDSEGRLILNGDFSTVSGVSLPNFARLNADGTLDNTFQYLNLGYVRKMSISTTNKMLISGAFTQYLTATQTYRSRKGLLRLNANGTLDEDFNKPNGVDYEIEAMVVQPDNKILIGGSFETVANKPRKYLARLNADGTLDSSFVSNANGIVKTIALQPDGKIIIGGEFTTYNGSAKNRLARLNSDGTLDSSFSMGTGPSASVHASYIQADGKIIIGGGFLAYNGTYALRLARINIDGSLDASFNASAGLYSNYSTTIDSIAVQPDGKILIGGYFSVINNVNRVGIVRLNVDGTIDENFDVLLGGRGGSGAYVYSVVILEDGKILIGGYFTKYTAQGSISNFLRVNASGSIDSSFYIPPEVTQISNVYAIVVQREGDILLGGAFSRVDGHNTRNIVRFKGDGTYDPTFNAGNGFSQYVTELSITEGDKILAAGKFGTYDDEGAAYITRLHSRPTNDTWTECTFTSTSFAGSAKSNFVQTEEIGQGASDYVRFLKVLPDSTVLLGGNFYTYNNAISPKVAKLTTQGHIDTNFIVGGGFNSTIFSVLRQPDGKILVGGSFTLYNGMQFSRVARLNADGSADTSFNAIVGADPGAVASMALQTDGKILIGGTFTSYNSISQPYIARLNADGSLDTSFTSGYPSVYPQSIAVQPDGKIIIVGNFTTYDGVSRSRIARLNADGTLDTSFDPGTGANQVIYSAEVLSDGKIMIGGNFTTYNGTSINRIARLTSTGAIDGTFTAGTGANAYIFGIKVQADGKLLIFGNFTSYAGTTRNRIARLNAVGTLDATFDPGTAAGSIIYTADIFPDGSYAVGGNFTSFNGYNKKRYVKLTATGAVINEYNLMAGLDNEVRTITVQPDDKIVVGGAFTYYNIYSRNRVARLNSDGTLDATFTPGTGANGIVYASALQADGKILIGGAFTTYNGTTINRLARLNADGTLDVAFTVGTGANNTINTIKVQTDGKILIGGLFTTFNSITKNRILRLNADGTIDDTFTIGTGANGVVNTISIYANGKILIAGNFTTYNDTSSVRVARLLSSGALDVTFSTGTGSTQQVYSSVIQNDGKVILGVSSNGTYNDYYITTLYRLNDNGSLDRTFQFVFLASTAYALDTDNSGRVLVAGTSLNISVAGTTYNSNGLAILNSNGALDTTFGTEAITTYAMGQLSNGDIVAGGSFTNIGNYPIETNTYKSYIALLENTPSTTTFECTVPVPAQSQGIQKLYIRAKDNLLSSATEVITQFIDTQQPTKVKVSLTENTQTPATSANDVFYVNSKDFKLYFSVTDKYSDISYIKVSENKNFLGATWKEFDGDIDIRLLENKQTKLYIKVKDAEGNVSDVFTQYVYVDTIAPELKVNAVPQNVFNPTLSGTTEVGSFVKVWVNGKVYGQDSSVPEDGFWEVSKTNSANSVDFAYGANIIVFESEDIAGNKATQTLEYYLDPPFITATTETFKPQIDQTVLASSTPELVPVQPAEKSKSLSTYIRYALAFFLTVIMSAIVYKTRQSAIRIKDL